MDNKRNVELVVISDLHLGTSGCQAVELLKYLKSIKPKTLILNGDIIDIWQFKKNFFPKAHLKVIKHIMGLASDRCTVYYITGNHDEMFRKFSGMKIGKLRILNDLKLNLNGKAVWFFHGDIFDVVMQYSKWLSKLGAVGYDSLIWLNTKVNWMGRLFKFEPVSFSKKIKASVKGAVKFINAFEETAAVIAARKGIDTIVCGHIHHPEMRMIQVEDRSINYLNSGDWIENLTSLEYNNGQWKIFNYRKDFIEQSEVVTTDFEILVDTEVKQLFKNMLFEFSN
ncbi:MAG TPA: UDP-2,3-diacylglucosamine diphosphatase [Prolixibacteraceae bacterium]|nr:UDP-2,3-diacylglucosamine diphosphatase [Prolixibacteraceae bacterium]